MSEDPGNPGREPLTEAEREFRLAEVGARTYAESAAWDRARAASTELAEVQGAILKTVAMVDEGARRNAETALILSENAALQAKCVTKLGSFVMASMQELQAPPPPSAPKTTAMDVAGRVLEKLAEQVGGAFKGRGPELLEILGLGQKRDPEAKDPEAKDPEPAPPEEEEEEEEKIDLTSEDARIMGQFTELLPESMDKMSIGELRAYFRKVPK